MNLFDNANANLLPYAGVVNYYGRIFNADEETQSQNTLLFAVLSPYKYLYAGISL